MRRWTALAAGVAALAAAVPGHAEVLGERPAYLEAGQVVSEVANRAAIGRRIFTPGLDEDWVPQGLAVVGDHVLVSSYKPTPDPQSSKGPCRVFRIDRVTGKAAGQFDLPLESCNSHAGGLAYLGEGKLVVADTFMLSLVDLPKALAAGSAAGAVKTVKIKGLLRGSFAASRGSEAWIGAWSREPGKSVLLRLPPDFFEREIDAADESLAAERISIPAESQGAAFDAVGNLWVTGSKSNQWSKLRHVGRDGTVKAEHDMPMGLEGIAFDRAGRLWAVTEAGTRKYLRWGPKHTFPFVFEVDLAKLK